MSGVKFFFVIILALVVVSLGMVFVQSKDLASLGGFMAISTGVVGLFGLLYAVIRAYARARARDMRAEENPSQVGFVVATFHELVAKLKEKENELEQLRALAEHRADTVQEYNENVLQSVPSGVVGIDSAFKVAKLNASAQKILGLSAKEVVGRDVAEVFKSPLVEFLSSEQSVQRAEVRYASETGRDVWLGFSLTPLLDAAGSPIGKLLVFTDMTELKAFQSQAELRQRLSSLGEMAAGIAHELRNSMGVIAGYAKLLSRQVEGPLSKTVQSISREVSEMDSIIDDFLSFARPGEPKVSGVELRALIAECAKSTAGQRQDVAVLFQGREQATVAGDEVLLRQAFTNLIKNSVDSMPDGGEISITIETAGGDAEILISDTGHGVPEELRERIFLPFYSTKERGIGLGLAVVHRMITLHGGTLKLVPSEAGAAFAITLPLGGPGVHAGPEPQP